MDEPIPAGWTIVMTLLYLVDELDCLLVGGVPGALPLLGPAAPLDADVPAKVRPTHRQVLEVSALSE